MMQQGSEDTTTTDPMEVKVPILLLSIGLVIIVAYGFIKGGPSGGALIIGSALIQLAIGVPLAILACFIAARIADIHFGLLHTAVLKLASAFLFPSAVALVIPIGIIGWLVSLLLYWMMLEKFFDLDPTELAVCIIAIFIVRLGAVLLGGLILAT